MWQGALLRCSLCGGKTCRLQTCSVCKPGHGVFSGAAFAWVSARPRAEFLSLHLICWLEVNCPSSCLSRMIQCDMWLLSNGHMLSRSWWLILQKEEEQLFTLRRKWEMQSEMRAFCFLHPRGERYPMTSDWPRVCNGFFDSQLRRNKVL